MAKSQKSGTPGRPEKRDGGEKHGKERAGSVTPNAATRSAAKNRADGPPARAKAAKAPAAKAPAAKAPSAKAEPSVRSSAVKPTPGAKAGPSRRPVAPKAAPPRIEPKAKTPVVASAKRKLPATTPPAAIRKSARAPIVGVPAPSVVPAGNRRRTPITATPPSREKTDSDLATPPPVTTADAKFPSTPITRPLDPIPSTTINPPTKEDARARTDIRPSPPLRPVIRLFGNEVGWTALDGSGDDEETGNDGDDEDDDDEFEDEAPRSDVRRGPPSTATGREDGWVALSDDRTGAAPAFPRAIPPLPDDDDVFEPIEAEEDEPPREPPPGATPHDVLARVRRGALHVSALNAIPDEMIEALAEDEGLVSAPGGRRADLLRRLIEHRVPEPARPAVAVDGLLELFPEGFGFLRRAEYGYVRATSDPFVPAPLVRELALQTGHWLEAKARPPRSDEKYPEVIEILGVNHEEPTAARGIAPFDTLTVTHPDKRFILETEPAQVSMRLMDLFCPLGRGQRALVVSPPRAGKTILLQGIADSLARNSPEVDIVVLLVDERPEEVTNMRRSIRGEVFASTFDQPSHRHIRLAELVLEKVKRMVEFGRHVVLLLDSLTRLGRAYNNESAEGGRLLTGGLDASALTKPKAFFGAARNIENGGSLTIVASALVDTGSRLDQVIFEEFKGTGNMEIALSRDLAYRRLWPAIDIPKSGTRKEDLLLHPEELRRITVMRRAMAGQEAPEVLTDLLYKMEKHRTNAEFLMMVQG